MTLRNTGARLLAHAKREGAKNAVCQIETENTTTAEVIHGKLEKLSDIRTRGAQLRVHIGSRVGVATGNDLTDVGLESLARQACAIAKENMEDPHAHIAGKDLWPSDVAATISALELDDGRKVPSKELVDMAHRMEETVLSQSGITRTEGAEYEASRGSLVRMNADGFVAEATTSLYGGAVSGIIGEGTDMESDYAYRQARHMTDLPSPEEIGLEAAQRALSRRGSRPIKTCELPVIFDRRTSNLLPSFLLMAISGEAIFDGASFLKNSLGEKIFPENVSIVEDPFIKRGLGSSPFDEEGVRKTKQDIVTEGVLNTWITSLRSASKLGTVSTGHAGGPANLCLTKGSVTRDDLIGDIKRGLLLTSFQSHGPQVASGDCSAGGVGFLIEDGAITQPVGGITVAGNLADMFSALIPADDLILERKTEAPTCYVGTMTVAGD